MSVDNRGLTAADKREAAALQTYLRGKGSPLADQATAFVFWGHEYGVDPRLLVAVAGAETSFGMVGGAPGIHNPFGIGPGRTYRTWESAIADAAKLIGTNDLYKGRSTIAQIGGRWAPVGVGNDPTNLNANWPRNVSRFFRELGGDPSKTVRLDARATGLIPSEVPVIGGAVAAAQGAVTSTADLVARLASRGTWIRVGYVVGGATLIIIGIRVLLGQASVPVFAQLPATPKQAVKAVAVGATTSAIAS